ncbi:cell wall hydrolase [Litchfieldella qijiaojingensis]|uniref:Cell wall hydrolase n=1 Tax=Litchfieldella qijiaojingensis TaxID=980347 RepID=A0ABQ2YR32_9GAMM|nr:cell wall hydrolase [Halomonas qijiaojingensis]GGX92034.1 cell wall hydrolase [Halomonas qijiaojingensis]
MRQFWIAFCLATILVLNQTVAAEQEQQAEAAESKAEELEQNVVDDAAPTPAEIITGPEAQAVDPQGEAPLDNAITCLARTIYWEARGEEVADMEAVANVVMNRLGNEIFPDTVCGVVMQGSEEGTCQFSWWCDGRPDIAEEEESYVIAKEIARKALNGQLTDRTDGALYFHHRDVTPDWAAEYLKTAEAGEFLFYKPDESVEER